MYKSRGLPLKPVNVRSREFRRFDRKGPVWIHRTRGFDPAVLEFLRHFWPLDYPSRLHPGSK